jgi:hypothetical protein
VSILKPVLLTIVGWYVVLMLMSMAGGVGPPEILLVTVVAAVALGVYLWRTRSSAHASG